MPSVLTTILANIPWGQVVESAPKLAQGASRLWETVKNRRQAPPASDEVATAAAEEPTDEMALLQARTRELQAQVQGLQEQMRASAELVKELAEQNASLVQSMEAMRERIKRLAVVGGVCVAGLAAALFYLLAAR